jgi:TonB family protein
VPAGPSGVVGVAKFPGWGSLKGMPGQVPAIDDYPSMLSDGSCSTAQVYNLVKSWHLAKLPPITLAALPPPLPGPQATGPPSKIPKDIKMIKEDAAPANCSVMGMAGTAPGGVMGGIATAPSLVVAAPNPLGPVRIPSGMVAGMIISRTDPIYPPVAKAAHVQGAVVLHAILSKVGSIENLQVISGPPMLRGSAMDAVKDWKYRPYIINGAPVEVDTTITVNFTIGDSAAPPK